MFSLPVCACVHVVCLQYVHVCGCVHTVVIVYYVSLYPGTVLACKWMSMFCRDGLGL